MLRELGVHVSGKGRQQQSHQRPHLQPRQKLRAGILAVMASIRMRKLEQHWRGVRALGEELERQKNREKGGRMLGKWVHAALVN